MIRALVVDNNPVLLRAIAAFLEKKGCRVVTATNGLEALNFLKAGPVDILFTDLVMPLVSGEQLCKIVRSTPAMKDTYIVVVSGIVLEDLENILSAEHYDFCIAKGPLHELKKHIYEAVVAYENRSAGLLSDAFIPKIPEGLEKSSIAVELLNEQKHLVSILDNLEEGIIELDGTGTVVSANRAALSILELHDSEIIGKKYDTFQWSDYGTEIKDWVLREIVQGRAEQSTNGTEQPIRYKDKILTLSLIRIEKGSEFFSVCIIRDITRRFIAEQHERRLNQAMELIRKMESLSSMAGGVAHDFNNLLTVICGNLDMLLQQMDTVSRENMLLMLEYAKDAAYKAVALSTKISHSSPYGIVSHTPLELQGIVSETVNKFSSDHDAVCRYEESDEAIIVRADRQQIATAIGNVLDNSFEVSADRAIRVGVSIEAYEKSTVLEGQYIPEGSYAAVTITDKGPGIKKSDLLKIFDPYFSTKQRGVQKGMGLGLTVVYATMRNHGGYVVVQSEQGKGTKVRLLLPLVESRAKAARYETVIEPVSGKHVLLAEQDLQSREICRTILEFLGCTVSTTDDVDSVAELLSDRGTVSTNQTPDILFINPTQCRGGGIDLIKVAEEIVGIGHIVVTGLSSLDSRMEQFRKLGVSRYLNKPYTFDGIKMVLGMGKS